MRAGEVTSARHRGPTADNLRPSLELRARGHPGEHDDVVHVMAGLAVEGSVNQTLTERWDGSAWRVVASPDVGGDDNVLLGTSAAGGSTVFAVGGFTNPSERTLVLQNAQA